MVVASGSTFFIDLYIYVRIDDGSWNKLTCRSNLFAYLASFVSTVRLNFATDRKAVIMIRMRETYCDRMAPTFKDVIRLRFDSVRFRYFSASITHHLELGKIPLLSQSARADQNENNRLV